MVYISFLNSNLSHTTELQSQVPSIIKVTPSREKQFHHIDRARYFKEPFVKAENLQRHNPQTFLFRAFYSRSSSY